MVSPARIALVGDRDPEVPAHRAIPLALDLARKATGGAIEWDWIATPSFDGDPAAVLRGFSGVWCVPASPYSSTRGALDAIGHARRTGLAFLGTCGGFQHALLEYAESVWGLEHAGHAELDPDSRDPVIAALSCSLVERRGSILPVRGSRLAGMYREERVDEGYHCSYGLSPTHAHRLERGPLRVAARDDAGEVRAVELDGHPFYFATLFQPERRALDGRSHPLIEAFVTAAGSSSSR